MLKIKSEVVLSYHVNTGTPKVIRRVYVDNTEVRVHMDELGRCSTIGDDKLLYKTQVTYVNVSNYIRTITNYWFTDPIHYAGNQHSTNFSRIELFYKENHDCLVGVGIDHSEYASTVTIAYSKYMMVIYLKGIKGKTKDCYKILHRFSIKDNYENHENTYSAPVIVLSCLVNFDMNLLGRMIKFLTLSTFNKFIK